MGEGSAPVDWGLARRLSVGIAGLERPGRTGPAPLPIDPAWLREVSREAEPLVVAATGLEPRSPVPDAELVDRASWIDLAIVPLRDAADEVEAVLAELREKGEGGEKGENAGDAEKESRRDGLGPLAPFLKPVVGAVAATEVAAALGLIARRVLGQYEIALIGAEREPRLLFVEPNLLGAVEELDVDRAAFLRWVALHEMTHAIQFSSVPWLRDHISGLVRELIRGTAGSLGGAGGESLLAKLAREPRETARAAMRGELVQALAGPENAALLDRIQATMAVVEGHAEWAMDVSDPDGEFEPLRSALEARRDRGGIAAIIGRILGFEQKLRQYRLGRAFCLAVVERGGPEALRSVWDSPDRLPSLAELEAPDEWLERVGTGSAA